MASHKEVHPLLKAEVEAREVLSAEYDEYLEAIDMLLRIINELITAIAVGPVVGASMSKRVTLALLPRLFNDIRCTVLAAEFGYALQAASMSASAFETGFSLALAGSSDEEAKRWAKHDNPKRLWKPIKKLVGAVRDRDGRDEPKARADRDYRNYRELCLAKHANPLIQKSHGQHLFQERVEVVSGPDYSEGSIRVGMHALDNALRCGLLGVEAVVATHASPAEAVRIAEFIRAVGEVRARLNRQGADRWGVDDPFPGRW